MKKEDKSGGSNGNLDDEAERGAVRQLAAILPCMWRPMNNRQLSGKADIASSSSAS